MSLDIGEKITLTPAKVSQALTMGPMIINLIEKDESNNDRRDK